MTFETWAAFAAMSAALLAAPGPMNAVIAAYGLQRGPSAVWPLALGIAAADTGAVALALAGHGALMPQDPAVAALFESGVALLLLVTGLRLCLAAPLTATTTGVRRLAGATPLALAAQGFAVTILNPLSVVIYAGLLAPARDGSGVVSGAILLATFLALSLGTSAAYGLGAARLHGRLVGPWAARICQRVTGAMLLVGAVVLGLGAT